MRKAVLAVAVAAVVGGGLWWWLHRSHDEPAQGPTAKSETARTRAPRAGGTEEPTAAAAVLVEDDPQGELRLEGIVLDADEKPVGGALVTLGSNPPREATSEADGGFAFDHLVGRQYTLVARAKQGVAGPVTSKLTAKSPPVELHLRPGAKVVVSVAGTDGKSVDGATVELRGTDTQTETTKHGTATFASVVPGGYQIAGWTEHTARALQWINVGAGDNQAKLVLVPGAPVAGRVVDDHGTGIAGARVTFHGASDWSQQADDRRDGVTTDSTGAFRFSAVAAGSFRFAAAHPQFAPGTSQLVKLDGKSDKAGVTITLSAGASVKGRVVDAGKQPVAGARVRVGVASRRGMVFAPPRQAYSDAKGEFEIKGLPKQELEAVAMHETGASQTKPLDTSRGDVSGIELVIDVTGTIAGIVVDSQGTPIEGAQVSAGPNFREQGATRDWSQWRLRGFPQELTDSNGRFTLSGLAPGSYNVSAARSRNSARGRRGMGEGVVAETGTKDLKIVLQPEGAVKGRVAFVDGTPPQAFTISAGMMQQSFVGDGAFELDSLAPQKYELNVRGPQFQSRVQEVLVEPGKTADVGTILVEKGRALGGTVVALGKPVPGATVSAGRLVFGNGTTASSPMGMMGGASKSTTTDTDGTFSLAGFGDGDLTLVAEHPDFGRSKAMRVSSDAPGQDQLVLELQPPGALSGVMRQNGKPIEGIIVTCQSTTTPGALYGVASGPDGSYRYDRLAPDTYKVSATVGMPMLGMKFYSKQVVVPSGQEVTVDLTVDPGAVTLDVTPVTKSGQLGVATAWLANGTLTAQTAQQLQLAIAAAGPGASQLTIIRAGEAAKFTEVQPGAYSACVVPFPIEVKGMAAMGYSERHGDKLPAYCQPVTVQPSPPEQAVQIPVEIPPLIPDATPKPNTH